MIHLYQPAGSKICGQVCVAMACGITIDEAVELVGRGTRRTLTPHLRKALSKYFVVPPRCIRATETTPIPARAIVKLTFPNLRGWHWVLWWDGIVYDPYPYPSPTVKPGTYSSFLPLTTPVKQFNPPPCPACDGPWGGEDCPPEVPCTCFLWEPEVEYSH